MAGKRRTPSEEKLRREMQALELFRARLPYEQIGSLLTPPMTASGAWKLIQAALRRAPVATVEDLRREFNDMYNRLHRSFWPAARGGDVEAAKIILEIAKHQRRLNGADAPLKIDAQVRNKLDAEIEDLLDQMASAAAAMANPEPPALLDELLDDEAELT